MVEAENRRPGGFHKKKSGGSEGGGGGGLQPGLAATLAHEAAARLAATGEAAKHLAATPPSAHEGMIPSNTAALAAAASASASEEEGRAADARERAALQTEAVLARTAQAWSDVLPAGEELRAAAEGGGPHASYRK